MNLLEAALDLADQGWAVLPCHKDEPGAKRPYTDHGHLEASRDTAAIWRWWTRWPDALIGARVPDSLLALDIDPRNGGNIEELEALVGLLPVTLTAFSGRGDGGRHLYFTRPAGLLTSARLPEGIDLKAAGYLIMPPSPHPATGNPYLWERHPVAPLPPRLRELLRPEAVVRHTPLRRSGSTSGLLKVVGTATEGQRNNALFWASCRAAEEGRLDGALEADLLAASASTGLPAREARRVLASARRTAGAR